MEYDYNNKPRRGSICQSNVIMKGCIECLNLKKFLGIENPELSVI